MVKRRFYSSALRETRLVAPIDTATTTAILANEKILPMGVFPSEPPTFLLGMLGPDPAMETLHAMQHYAKTFRMEPLGAFAMPITVTPL